jgi:hypothetical protein
MRIIPNILTVTLCAGIAWMAAAGAAEPATEPEKKPAPQTAPASPQGDKPAAVHPIRTQTTFVVDPSQVRGADPGKGYGPITVTLNYFDKLPGIDLDKLSPQRRQRVLERANKELCTCGCKGDTVARCLVNDPSCKLVKSLAQQIYEEERVRPETK